MKLAELLHASGQGLIKIRAQDCIADAATALTANKIVALLVEDDNGDIVGILSERDIVGGMGPHGADLHDQGLHGRATRVGARLEISGSRHDQRRRDEDPEQECDQKRSQDCVASAHDPVLLRRLEAEPLDESGFHAAAGILH